MRTGSALGVARLFGLVRQLPAAGAAEWANRGTAAVAGVLSIGLRGVLLLGKFAFIVILAKFTDASTVGIYSLIMTMVTIAIYVIGLEIHTFTTREIVVDQGSEHRAIHIQSHLLTLCVIYLLALPAIWMFVLWLGISGKFSFFLLATVILLEVFGQELGRYLLVLSRPVASNALQFIRGAAWMPFPMALLLFHNKSGAIDSILLSWAGGSLLACLFGVWHIRASFAKMHRYRVAWLTQAFMSARHYFLVAVLTQVQYYSDRFIVQRVMGEASVGILSFYQSFANTMVTFVQTGVIAVMLPRLLLAAKQNDALAEVRTQRSMFVWAMSLAVIISVMLGLGMPLLLQQLHKPAYVSSLPIFYVLLVGNVMLVAGIIVHLSLYARRKDVQLMRVSLVVIPLGLATNIVAVPIFGLPGAAFTFVATASVDFIVKFWLLRRGLG